MISFCTVDLVDFFMKQWNDTIYICNCYKPIELSRYLIVEINKKI